MSVRFTTESQEPLELQFAEGTNTGHLHISHYGQSFSFIYRAQK